MNSVDRKISKNEQPENIGTNQTTQTAANIADTLSHTDTHMSQPTEKVAPVITLEDVKAHLEGNVNTLNIATLIDHDMMAGSVVCGDGRTVGANVPKDNDNISNVQIFGGYSGFNLGMIAGLKKGLGEQLSDEDIIAINQAFTANMKNIYEHTDDDHEHHAGGKCGCGHLNNLRDNADMFGLTPALIAHHKELMHAQGITPDELIDKHREKGVILIANSKKKDAETNEETIATIFSNKYGNDDQYFVVNADALGIMLDSAAEKYAKIIADLMPGKEITKDMILDAFARAIGEQTISTATKLASHLAANNTFIFDGENVSPINLMDFATANLKTFADQN